MLPVVIASALFLLPASSLTAQRESAANDEEAAVAAVQGMVGQNLGLLSGRSALCLAAYSPRGIQEVSGTLLGAVSDSLRGTAVKVSTLRMCPRTYASLIARVDSLGRPVDVPPRGTLDPVYVVLEPAVVTTSGA